MQKLKQMWARVRFFDPPEDWALMTLLGIIGLLVAIFSQIVHKMPLVDLVYESFVVGAAYFAIVCVAIYFVVNEGIPRPTTHDFALLWMIPTTYCATLISLGSPFVVGFSLLAWVEYGWPVAVGIFIFCCLGALISTLITIVVSYLVWLVEPFLERSNQKYRELVRELRHG